MPHSILIMTKSLALLTGLLFFTACAQTPPYTHTPVKEQPPNIVVLFIDDMGYGDPSSFGNQRVDTPNIDRLAQEGTKYTHFYVNSPICSASRVALKTGVYPQRELIHSFLSSRKHNRKRKMPDFLSSERATYAKLFQNAGYKTAHFGKWHLGGGRDVDNAPLPQAYGYDESLVSFEGLGDRILWSKTGNQRLSWKHGQGKIYERPKHQTTETYVDRAITFMEKHRGAPFLINIFPNDVHDGHVPSQAQEDKWRGKGRNAYEDKFFAVLDAMDQQIGRVLDTLDTLELSDNTLVIFTSDNGPTDWKRYYDQNLTPPGSTQGFRGRKWSLYEGGIRMPFIIRWPNRIKANTVNDKTVVAAIDLFPSLAALTQTPIPSKVEHDGENLADVFLGNSRQRTKPVFWEYGVHGSIKPGKAEHVSPQLAMRDQDYKLLMNANGSRVELYNLKNDPKETRNLSRSHPQQVANMKPQLRQWWTQMNLYYEQPHN